MLGPQKSRGILLSKLFNMLYLVTPKFSSNDGVLNSYDVIINHNSGYDKKIVSSKYMEVSVHFKGKEFLFGDADFIRSICGSAMKQFF